MQSHGSAEKSHFLGIVIILGSGITLGIFQSLGVVLIVSKQMKAEFPDLLPATALAPSRG